jgi:hypothetical protein
MKQSKILIWPQYDEQTEQKRKRNRSDYLARKSSKTDILLRLDKSDANALDLACKSRGLSRSAFFAQVLLPMLATGHKTSSTDTVPNPADEFDALFMST